jgi:membrane protease YdiL (CAAX protease family)
MLNTIKNNTTPGVKIGILYTVFLFCVAAYFNYIRPYDPDPITDPGILQLAIWALLYLPLGIFVLGKKWEISEFGFYVTRNSIAASILIILLCSAITWGIQIPWQNAMFEAFARTGEEIFFRGFLFVLLLKIFHSKQKPWIWAVVISSAVFAMVHTQTFQTSFLENYSSGSLLYRIFERLFNVFAVGAFFATIRYWTRSIIPVALMHSAIQGGILALPFCVLICASITLWAHMRKESIFQLGKAK